MAIIAQLCVMRAPPFQQRVSKSRAALRIAERINLKFKLQMKFVSELVDHDQQFRIGGSILTAENLYPELMELAKAALLRTLAPEHRPGIVKPLFRITPVHPRLDIRPHYARCTLGTKRHYCLGLVL